MRALCEIMAFDPAFATDELVRAALPTSCAANPEHIANFAAGLGRPRRGESTLEDIASIRRRLMIIHGRDDRVVHFEAGLRLVSTIANSRLVLLNRCGHWAQLEHADEFNRLVRDFITNTPGHAEQLSRRETDMSELLDRIEELADLLADQAEEADALGHLPDVTHKALREAGIVKALQPKDFGGAELHPREFFEGILAHRRPLTRSAGWVSSVVGVHSFEIAQGTRQVQEEIWGEDPDTWVASPYAPDRPGQPHRRRLDLQRHAGRSPPAPTCATGSCSAAC